MISEPVRTKVATHQVDTGHVPVIHCVLYRSPLKWKELVREEVISLIEKDIVVTIKSPLVISNISCGQARQ